MAKTAAEAAPACSPKYSEAKLGVNREKVLAAPEVGDRDLIESQSYCVRRIAVARYAGFEFVLPCFPQAPLPLHLWLIAFAAPQLLRPRPAIRAVTSAIRGSFF